MDNWSETNLNDKSVLSNCNFGEFWKAVRDRKTRIQFYLFFVVVVYLFHFARDRSPAPTNKDTFKTTTTTTTSNLKQ